MNANLSQQLNDGFGEEFGRSASVLAAGALGQTWSELTAPITPILRFFYKNSFGFGSEATHCLPSDTQRGSRPTGEPLSTNPFVTFQLPAETMFSEMGDDLDFYPPHTHWGINE